eukprot:NODE_803_length_3808_cov_1.057381.p2 type:complete len:260 gc:universal NODE_803_length_3808_cov_1.057381:1348-569(-)
MSKQASSNMIASLRPYMPLFSRLFLVFTFIEDAIRVQTQFDDQTWYLQNHRGFNYGLAWIILVVNVLVMWVGSILVIANKYTIYACSGLAFVVINQIFVYGMLTDIIFISRSFAVLGGLLLLYVYANKKKYDQFSLFDFNKTQAYLQLTSRLLIVCLFLSILFGGEMDFLRAIISVAGLICCAGILLGYQSNASTIGLVVLMTLFNMFTNNWWSLHHQHPHRDFMKYDFFQTFSILGGLILLVYVGPGEVSLDERKKAM